MSHFKIVKVPFHFLDPCPPLKGPAGRGIPTPCGRGWLRHGAVLHRATNTGIPPHRPYADQTLAQRGNSGQVCSGPNSYRPRSGIRHFGAAGQPDCTRPEEIKLSLPAEKPSGFSRSRLFLNKPRHGSSIYTVIGVALHLIHGFILCRHADNKNPKAENQSRFSRWITLSTVIRGKIYKYE